MRPVSLRILCVFILFLSAVMVTRPLKAQTITTYAGGIGDNLNAVTYGRVFPTGVTVDPAGNVYIADNGNGRIRKVSPSGTLTSIEGTNINGGSGSTFGNQAIYSGADPYGITIDGAGNIYFSNGGVNRNQVFEINTSGIITVIAGISGCCGGFSGDGSLATNAELDNVEGVAIDNLGNIYLADAGNSRIRKVNTSGIITTIAGGGSLLGDGGPAVSANLNQPGGVTVDVAGNVYIADYNNRRIRKVNTAGIITTIAGGGSGGAGGPATAANIGQPVDVKLDGLGNIFFTSGSGTFKINTSGILISESGVFGGGLYVDGADNIYTGFNTAVNKVASSGTITLLAGNGLPVNGHSGDGGNALLAEFGDTHGISSDLAGNIYFVDNTNYIRKISTTGIISNFAGSGIIGYYGDGGLATAAELDAPTGTAVDRLGNVYIADNGTSHIRKVTGSGLIYTIAGGGSGGIGDGGPATAAVITAPGVAADSAGNVYIADAGHNRIRRIDAATDVITTVAGNGTGGYTGDGGAATNAELEGLSNVAVDRYGNVFFSVSTGIRKVDTAGIITTFSNLNGYLTVDSIGNLYVAVPNSYTIYKVDKYGYQTTVAGNGHQGYVGDLGPATAAEFFGPNGIAIDGSRHLYVTEFSGCCSNASVIRQVCCMSDEIDNPPFFTHGNSATFTICSGSGASNIDSLLTISDLDTGQTETWTVSTPPTHGILGGFPTSALSTGGIVTPSGLAYTPNPGYSGSDNFLISVSDGIDQNTFTVTVVVNSLPNAGSISGPGSLCSGSSANLTESASGGSWSVSNSNATITTSGQVTGVSAGTSVISYAVTNSCGSAFATHTITVNLSPAGIAGAGSVCAGSSITLSDLSSGGTWSSGNTAVATIGTAGFVTGVAAGTTGITYILPDGCKSTTGVMVNPLPNSGTIAGYPNLCPGGTETVTDRAGGGIWRSSANASITSGGFVTALSAGADTLFYTVTNGCGVAIAYFIFPIFPNPNAGAITGPSSVCASSFITLSDTVTGGTWSSSSPRVSIGAYTGVVAAIAPGAALIYYTVSNSCGTAVDSTTISIVSTPWAGTITGFTTLCIGDSATLSDTVRGGAWSSGNPFVATISSTGVAHGIATGSSFISYTVTNACGEAVALAIATVNVSATIDGIAGASSICSGVATTFTDGTPGGVWSSSDTAIATISGSGIATGIVGGITTISYVVNAGCGYSVATTLLSVASSPTAGTLSGATDLCAGASGLVISSETGGIWTASNLHASVTPLGLATGFSAGLDTLTYSVSNSCGTAHATHTVSIFPSPVSGTISGDSILCAGTAAVFSDTASGGAWSSSNGAVATAGSSGVVNGISAGTAMISYAVTNGCGSAISLKNIAIQAPDAGYISGVTTLCPGESSTLTDPEMGGTWSSTAVGVASVGSTGVVRAVAAGSARIIYTVSGSCGSDTASVIFTVGDLPVVSPISGAASLCTGRSTPYSDGTLGGAWMSSNPTIALAGSAGLVTGISAGTAVISYLVTAGCGEAGASQVITIDTIPNPGTISGSLLICKGTTDSFFETVPGGAWASSNITIASINEYGQVTANTTGVAGITYIVGNSCGVRTTSVNITVIEASAGVISGITTLCPGGSAILSDLAGDGSWISQATTVATIDTTGRALAVAPGNAQVLYVVSNACGSDTALATITVLDRSTVSPVLGADELCIGNTTTFTDGTVGGSWSSSSLVASIGTSGIVTGVSAGTCLISYTVAGSCGSAVATASLRVDTLPVAGSISGHDSVCKGSTDTLITSRSGGTWSISNAAVAIVSASGVLSATDTGSATVFYQVTNSCGASLPSSFGVTVVTIPDAGIITGNTILCEGATTLLTDDAGGSTGAWSSGNVAIAAIGSTGIVSGLAGGIADVTYSVTNSCGTGFATTPVNVAALPGAGVITAPGVVCTTAGFDLLESSQGGWWSSGNTTVATVDSSTGFVNAISAGTVVITYTTPPNAANCINTTTYVLQVVSSHPFSVSGIVSPVNCYGNNNGSIQVIAGSDPCRFGWSNGDSSGTISNLAPGMYTVYVLDLITQCNGTDSFRVTSPDSLSINATITGDSCKAGGSIALMVSGGVAPYSYLWSSQSTSMDLSGVPAGLYTVLVTDRNNCERTGGYQVDAISCSSNEVEVHDVITPNGDGINDYWVIDNLVKYPDNSVQVFDKLGDPVYSKSHYNNDWDGKATNGTPLPDGTYFYLVRLNAANTNPGEGNVFKGSLLIKR